MPRRLRSYPSSIRTLAKSLRQQGLTHTEICQRIGAVPQATLSYWLRGIQLNGQHKARIDAKILASAAAGRPLARLAWARKVQRWREQIDARVLPVAEALSDHPGMRKLICGIMYLCEGAKYPTSQQVMFGNTDPAMIGAFLTLLRTCYLIDERKLRVRVMRRWDQDGEELKRYWSTLTQVPLDQFYPAYADKRTRGIATRKTGYRGVCCIQYPDVSLQYELQAIGAAVVKRILVEQRGIEPRASTMPLSRSPN